jgi:hypothetical protein
MEGLDDKQAFARLKEIYPDLSFSKSSMEQYGRYEVVRIKPLAETAIPPGDQWQKRAREVIQGAQERMLGDVGIEARQYLMGRGLTEDTIRKAGLGFIPKNDNGTDFKNTAARWGMTGDDIILYSGILFPYQYKGDIWKIRIRRLGNDVPKEERYRSIRGSANGLYRADDIKPGHQATVFEGEIDALSAWQSIGNEVTCVALGGTPGARIPTWVTRLSLASDVLLCFDNEEDPDKTRTAIEYWSKRLDNARVYHLPGAYHDANDMLQKGDDLCDWIQSGLSTPIQVAAPSTQNSTADPEPDFRCVECGIDLSDLGTAAISEDDGLPYCNYDETGRAFCSRGPGRAHMSYAQFSEIVQNIATVFGPGCTIAPIEKEYTLAQRVEQLKAEWLAQEPSEIEQAIITRLKVYNLFMWQPCACGCRLAWVSLGDTVCAHCEPAALWSNQTLAMLEQACVSMHQV